MLLCTLNVYLVLVSKTPSLLLDAEKQIFSIRSDEQKKTTVCVRASNNNEIENA